MDVREITVFELAKFKIEANEIIGEAGIEALAAYLSQRPDAGVVIPASGGVRKLRWPAKGKGKRGGARVIYIFLELKARIHLISCYTKNAKSDLTAVETKEIRKIAAYLKGVQ